MKPSEMNFASDPKDAMYEAVLVDRARAALAKANGEVG